MKNIKRAHTDSLFSWELSNQQLENSKNNISETKLESVILNSYPRRIILELTNQCNINCIMCGRNFKEFKATYLDYRIIQWLYPIFFYSEEVTLMGWGEPTLHPKFLDILSLIDKTPIKKYICTNGFNLNTILFFLFKYNIDILSISINGITARTNDKTRKGSKIKEVEKNIHIINKLRNNSKKPYLSLVFCLMKSNYFDLEFLLDFAASLNVDRVKIVHLTVFSKKIEQESLYYDYELLKKYFDLIILKSKQYNIEVELPYLLGEDPASDLPHKRCSLSWRDLFIGSDGFIRPCMSTCRKFSKIAITNSFFECWNSDFFINHRKTVNNLIMPFSCAKCYQSSVCNWNNFTSYFQYANSFAPNWK